MDRTEFTDRLIDALSKIEFDRHYYERCQQLAATADVNSYAPDLNTLREALDRTGLDWTYNKKERFFQHRTSTADGAELRFKVALSGSSAEFILNLKTSAGSIGGPYPLLAMLVATKRDPDFTPSPPAPKLPFADDEQLAQVVEFGLSLFKDAKHAIDSAGSWNGQDAPA